MLCGGFFFFLLIFLAAEFDRAKQIKREGDLRMGFFSVTS